MKKLSNTEAELKKSVAYKKGLYHTVAVCVYIYDIPKRKSKPKSKCPDENKNSNRKSD